MQNKLVSTPKTNGIAGLSVPGGGNGVVLRTIRRFFAERPRKAAKNPLVVLILIGVLVPGFAAPDFDRPKDENVGSKTHDSVFERSIDAPPPVVFPLITEGDQIARWAKDDRLMIAFPEGKTARVGMQIKFTIKVPTDPFWTVEIRELKSEEKMVTEFIDGIFRGTLSFYLEPDGRDRTRLIHRARIDPHGSFISFAWEVAGGKIHREKMEMIMERIGALAEEDWRTTTRRD